MGCRSWSVRRARSALTVVAVLAVALPLVPQPAATGTVGDAVADDAAWTTPTRPPRCTTEQVDSGNVAGCHVWGARGKPEDWGWPTPPFPETIDGQAWPPPGWVFDGWSFTGSPALAGWEARMASNPAPYGRIGTGRIRLLPEAMVLFDGFLREIAARGYLLRDGIGYNYRCTITSATNSCQGLTRTSLSMHAYGLAIDINGNLNPPRVYGGIDGATACATPMVTDMPQWLVQVAEKWGLYWGGYGWSSGCTSPTTARTTVYRDPTHFEFRGSPAQARAIAAFNGARGVTTCVDVVDDAGVLGERCTSGSQVLPAGTRTVVDTDAPAGAVSALVNITTTGTTQRGYVTAEPCGPAPAGQRPSNVNARPGVTVANLAIVPLDAEGRFCLFQFSPMHLVVDLRGFLVTAAAAPDGLTYRPVTPERALDTRTDSFCVSDVGCGLAGPVAAGAEVRVDVPVPGDASAALVNLTATRAETRGYLTADRCSTMAPGPQPTSNVNFVATSSVANLAVVPVDRDPAGASFCTFALQRVQLVTDLVGWFGPPSAGVAFAPAPVERVYDSRRCPSSALDDAGCGQLIPGGTIVRIPTGRPSSATLVNLTMVNPVGPGHATAGSCDALAPGPQPTSNVNGLAGWAVANLAVATSDPDGVVCVYVSVDTHLVVDVQGGFQADGSHRLVLGAAQRVLDTRPPT